MYRRLQQCNKLRYQRLPRDEQIKIRYLGYNNKGQANVKKSKELLDDFDYQYILPTDEQWRAIGVDEYKASQMEKHLRYIHELAVYQKYIVVFEQNGLKYNWVIRTCAGTRLVGISVDVNQLIIDRDYVPEYVTSVARWVGDILWN